MMSSFYSAKLNFTSIIEWKGIDCPVFFLKLSATHTCCILMWVSLIFQMLSFLQTKEEKLNPFHFSLKAKIKGKMILFSVCLALCQLSGFNCCLYLFLSTVFTAEQYQQHQEQLALMQKQQLEQSQQQQQANNSATTTNTQVSEDGHTCICCKGR